MDGRQVLTQTEWHLLRAQHIPVLERRVLEGEIVRKCLARSEKQCSIVEHRNYKARAADQEGA